MSKALNLPEPIQRALSSVPSKFPFEDKIDQGLNSLAEKVSNSRPTKIIDSVNNKIPYIPEIEVSTPFGKYKSPEFRLPTAKTPRLSDRDREVLKAAALKDVVGLVEMIPGVGTVGGFVINSVQDTAASRIFNLLSPDEYRYYSRRDKVTPLSSMAMIDTFRRNLLPGSK